MATACATLNVDGLGLRDYAQVNALSHVTSPMVSYTDLRRLSDIADMGQLRELHPGDIRGIELAPLLAMAAQCEVSLEFETGGPDPAQASVIAQLRASGVRVSTEEIAVVVCWAPLPSRPLARSSEARIGANA